MVTKPDVPSFTCRQFTDKFLATHLQYFINVFRDGSVHPLAAQLLRPMCAPHLDLKEQLASICEPPSHPMSSLRFLLSFQGLMHHGRPRKLAILTDSGSAIALLTKDNSVDLLVRTVAETVHGREHIGWVFVLQWVPPRAGIPGNKIADALASSARHPETPTLFLKRFEEARRLIKAIVILRHPNECVARGAPPLHVLYGSVSRAESSILCRLRTGSAFTSGNLEWFGRTNTLTCAGYDTIEDIQHVLWSCASDHQERLKLLATLLAMGRPHMTTEHLLFPTGGERYPVFTFRSVPRFMESTKLSPRL